MNNEKGFTLFELLIALFIGTLLVLAGVYAIRIGLFSMEKEETWFNDSTREKAAFDFFWQQTTSLHIQRVPEEKIIEDSITREKRDIFFVGKRDFLTFVSPLSLKKQYTQGLVIANYKVAIDEDGLWDLIYTESRLNPKVLKELSEGFKTNFRAQSNSIMYEDYTEFFKDCELITFHYLVHGDEDKEDENDEEDEAENRTRTNTIGADFIKGTKVRWKEKIIGKMPLAIKLTVTKNGEEQVLVVPIMVMYSSLVYGQ